MRRSSLPPTPVWSLVVVLLAPGCDCSGPVHSAGGPCAQDPPPDGCGQSCSTGALCPDGFYCHASGVCTADCTPARGCEGGTCTATGLCIRPDSGRLDGQSPFDGSGCAHVNVEATRVTPNVILVIDQSGSMTASFGSSDRWNALRDSLLSRPDGLVFAMQSQVRFGLALFSAEAPDNTSEPVVGMCPLITWVPPAIDNYAAIESVYAPESPIDETPTGDSLDAILARLAMTPDPGTDPTIFILATDGEPDTCEQPNPQEGQAEALAAAMRAYGAGIRTFIISVGRGTVSAMHLQDMANAGLGRGPGDPDAPYWVAGDDAGLRDALVSIIGGELSCVVTLNGRIEDLGAACTGTVRLNGRVLPCDDPDGWRVVDPTHIELQGSACTELQSGPGTRLEASFPCGVVLI